MSGQLFGRYKFTVNKKMLTYLFILVISRMSQNSSHDISRLLAREDSTCHRAFDEFSVSHKRIPNTVPYIIGQSGSFIASRWLDTVSSALRRCPPVQSVKQRGFVGQSQAVTTCQFLDLGGVQFLKMFLVEDRLWFRVDHVQTSGQKSRTDCG